MNVYKKGRLKNKGKITHVESATLHGHPDKLNLPLLKKKQKRPSEYRYQNPWKGIQSQ